MSLDNIRSEEFETLKSSKMSSHGAPYGSIDLDDRKKYNNTSILTYKTTIRDDHELTLMVGQEYVYDNQKSVTASAAMYDSDDIGLANLVYG